MKKGHTPDSKLIAIFNNTEEVRVKKYARCHAWRYL